MMADIDRRQLMAKPLRRLINDSSINRNDLRTCLETLITINKNYQTSAADGNDGHNKFAKIRTSNAAFRRKVWRFVSARDFLLTAGWTVGVDADDPDLPQVIRVATDKYDRQCLQVLVEHRDVKPNADDWDETSKVLTGNAEKERDEELKRKARAVREKEIKEFEVQKLRTKELNEMIKKEIIADNKYRQQFSDLELNKAISIKPSLTN